jgi:hypothetical protein
VVGYSLGGGVAFFTAVNHPELVDKVVVGSAHIRRDAVGPEMLAQQSQVSAAAVEFLKDTPMYETYQRLAPRPEDFGQLLDKIGESMAKDFDFSEEVKSLQVPTMLVAADADMAPPSHYVEAFKLLDGGLRDGGRMGEGRPQGGHALAILPASRTTTCSRRRSSRQQSSRSSTRRRSRAARDPGLDPTMKRAARRSRSCAPASPRRRRAAGAVADGCERGTARASTSNDNGVTHTTKSWLRRWSRLPGRSSTTCSTGCSWSTSG